MGHEREGHRAGDRTRAARYEEEVLNVGVKVRMKGIAGQESERDGIREEVRR
jgi:hypothetical protein